MLVTAILVTSAVAQDAIITGTDGDDVLTGSDTGEAIYARAGNDTVDGAGGNDDLDGGPGADVLRGGTGSDAVSYTGTGGVTVSLDGVANDGLPGEGDDVSNDVEDLFGAGGNDKLTGDRAANTIDGDAGDDRIDGGRGRDALFGGDGDDVIDARDGALDRVDCGAGKDLVTADANDVVSRDCERRARRRTTIKPGLTILPRQRRLIISSLVTGSHVVIACVRGCHPASPPSKAIITRRSVRLDANQTLRMMLPSRISGATIELGVTGPGSTTACVRYKVGAGFRSLTRQPATCTSAARRRP